MNSEGLQRWIDAQVQALNPESFMAQLALFLVVICVSLLAAAGARQLSRIFPLKRHRGTARQPAEMPQMAKTSVTLKTPVALKSTTSAELDGAGPTPNWALSSRQKKKYTKTKPKKFYANIEKAPSDPMFLPPFDANVPYRDRLAMIGSNKGSQA